MTSASFSLRVAIEGALPPMPLLNGNIYAIFAEEEQAGDALLWHTLLQACESSVPACLISDAPAASIATSGAAARITAAHAQKRLAIFTARSAGARGHALRRLLEDLDHWNANTKRLLVIDDAQRRCAQCSAEEIQELQAWAQRHRVCVLLFFRQASADDDAAVQLQPVADRFAGMARLAGRNGATKWEVLHWFSPSGLLAKTAYPLQRNAARQLEAVTGEAAAAVAAEPASDERRVIAERAAFQPNETPVSGWHLVAAPDDLLAQTAHAAAATVVLSFTPGADYVALARCVFELRQRCGAQLKIIVREVDARLRHSQESLIVRVGANLIVPAEIGYARFLSLVSMVQGQVFPHRLPPGFDDALREAAPDEEQGYLAPHAFLRTATATLQRSRALPVQSALLRLPLAYGLLPLDALRYCHIKRAGDVITADDRSIFLFLYACRETDIDKTLERLFRLPLSELFSTEDRFLSPHAIRQALDDLDIRHQQQAFPDLSAELAAAAQAQMPPQPALPAAAQQQGPAVQRHSAPPPATRRPLPVKGTPALNDVLAQLS